MKTEETIRLLSDKVFLDNLYGYAYRRCSTSQESEDLCSDITYSILRALRKGIEVENFYAFAWTIAHRTYADFCEKRKKSSDTTLYASYSESIMNVWSNPIDEFIDLESEKEQLDQIIREISFLSKIYRDVMVMYYLDEKRTAEIAGTLNITETAVKQRLFSARNTIRKEVETMGKDILLLKPVRLQFIGTGNPIGNDPREKAERSLSQNMIYLCKNEPKTAKDLSKALGVPMPYIEEEIDIQLRGLNGRYGLLRELDNGKFITNILIVDAQEYEEANEIYRKHLDEFCSCLKVEIEKSSKKMLSFPFLSSQDDLKFILWSLISSTVWKLQDTVFKIVSEKYFSDIRPAKREFTSIAIAVREGESSNLGFYGCDGVTANDIWGYSRIFISNIYGKRIERHFSCGHNLSTDPQILMTIRAIGGLDALSLSETEKEIAAKAIESGYLRKRCNILEPKILVFSQENQHAFDNLLYSFNNDLQRVGEKIAGDIAAFMKNRIPKHLMNEYQYYNSLIASVRLIDDTIEECIKAGLLDVPDNRICAEGTFMTVKK